MFSATATGLAGQLLEACLRRKWLLATAESCTGGLIAACLTDIAGSSAVVDRGFVTYSDGAKISLLGVPPAMLERVGAVSEEVARAMAQGACEAAGCHLAIAVTGIAGPGGGSAEKPVGTVHIAVASRPGGSSHEGCLFPGDRRAVREATLERALAMALAVARD